MWKTDVFKENYTCYKYGLPKGSISYPKNGLVLTQETADKRLECYVIYNRMLTSKEVEAYNLSFKGRWKNE